ncbi:Mob1/phocein [Pseudovirgaria hyperparasitica]|uniref:Mob1/phocein n=1 Tax=Pseudovirgaria hyperparasitica TaxID=470096 RepID=A0A6A6WLE2_9PEZI|nr:Mob1/phocein [Pseudovirgaria hyperparasitica]KAF2762966.1 Mob1/phocein [Pseudovirgaria hyperparasitica]
MAASPASSPRLPSPPPIAEDQIGPTSPGPATASTDDYGKLAVPQSVDHSAARRIRPGTKANDMAKGPPLVPLTEIDSPFQLTEHLKALHYSYTHPTGTQNPSPIDKTSARKLALAPEGVSRELWLYELCRFHTQNLNSIVITLFAAKPPCSSQTCPDMRASEWQYLCAVHDPPKSCCAIDYCCHTLDCAGNTLTSPKHFPSRLHLGSDIGNPDQQIRQLTIIFRRLYRIFAHAWFQHREVFWHVEKQSGLYIFFKTVIDTYELLPPDGYTIPEEADGAEDTPVEPKSDGMEEENKSLPDESVEEDAQDFAQEPKTAVLTLPDSNVETKVEPIPEIPEEVPEQPKAEVPPPVEELAEEASEPVKEEEEEEGEVEEVEAKTDPKTETETETNAEPEINAEPVPEPEAEPVAEPEPEPEPASESEPATEVAERESKAEVETVETTQIEADGTDETDITAAEDEPKAETEAEPEAESTEKTT